ncbi:MAG: hypothetical protein HC842_06260 [Cytophagales bacterium]|nr:hypothetical protein [Cytophagales bacterium]
MSSETNIPSISIIEAKVSKPAYRWSVYLKFGKAMIKTPSAEEAAFIQLHLGEDSSQLALKNGMPDWIVSWCYAT